MLDALTILSIAGNAIQSGIVIWLKIVGDRRLSESAKAQAELDAQKSKRDDFESIKKAFQEYADRLRVDSNEIRGQLRELQNEHSNCRAENADLLARIEELERRSEHEGRYS